jgi:hypothetical protein
LSPEFAEKKFDAKWKGGPEAAFYCIIRHRTSVLGF